MSASFIMFEKEFTMADRFLLGQASWRWACWTPPSCPSCRSLSSSSWSPPRRFPSLHWTEGSSSHQDICWRTPGIVFWFVVWMPRLNCQILTFFIFGARQSSTINAISSSFSISCSWSWSPLVWDSPRPQLQDWGTESCRTSATLDDSRKHLVHRCFPAQSL